MTTPQNPMPELVDLVIEDDRWETLEIGTLAQKACTATLAALKIDTTGCEIALLACDDSRITALNSDFRDKSGPTNVLSWPAVDLASEVDGGVPDLPEIDATTEPGFLGDIAISYETCMAEAADQGKSGVDHVTHLLVHGCLHLLGYDHVREKDAALMERLEVAILANQGIADPY